MAGNVNGSVTIIFSLACMRASSSHRNSPVNPSGTGYALKHGSVLCIRGDLGAN